MLEIDNRSGYYLNGEWRTDIDHVGLKVTLPGHVGLLAQWMNGATVWGWVTNGVHSVDLEFESNYLLLTNTHERHRVTVRYDHFEISDNDQNPLDDNSENGYAWTFAYQYNTSARVQLAAEWLEIFTNRPAWAYFGLAERKTERQLPLSLRLRFGKPN